MKALDFFFKNITVGQAETKRLKIERFIENYLNKPNTLPYLKYENITYPNDKSSYEIDYLDYDNPQIGLQRISVSINQELKDEYTKWVINVFPNETDIILNDNSIDLFVSKINEYVSDINNLDEPLKSIFKFLIEDYKSLLIKYHSEEFNSNMFVVPEELPYMRKFYFPEKSIKDLKAVFNFEGAKNPISKTITKDEWVNYFIYNNIPGNKIKLNYSTEVVSLLLRSLIRKYRGDYTQKVILEDIEKSDLFLTKHSFKGEASLKADTIKGKASKLFNSDLEEDKKLVSTIFACVK